MSTVARHGGNRGGKARKPLGGGKQAASRSLACPYCSSVNRSDARFCQQCGKSLSGTGWRTPQTLTVLASAIVVLVALALLFTSVIDPDRMTTDTPSAGTATRTAGSSQPPDLSTMTPREAADRLFNRVMMADEQGNRAEVEQFTPMAVSAYEMLDSLDTDALFHVGLIYAAAGEIDKATDYSERLKAVVPHHLLAAFLDHRLAEANNDPEAAAIAAKRFQDHYEEEINTGRPEYEHHRASIERFRTETAGANQSGS